MVRGEEVEEKGRGGTRGKMGWRREELHVGLRSQKSGEVERWV